VTELRYCVVSGYAGMGCSTDLSIHADAYIYTTGGQVVHRCHSAKRSGRVSESARNERLVRESVKWEAQRWIRAHKA
jgi:hypothetical protein